MPVPGAAPEALLPVMRSATQATSAEAVAVRTVPALVSASSPTKSPAVSSVTVASLPFWERTVSLARPDWRK